MINTRVALGVVAASDAGGGCWQLSVRRRTAAVVCPPPRDARCQRGREEGGVCSPGRDRCRARLGVSTSSVNELSAPVTELVC